MGVQVASPYMMGCAGFRCGRPVDTLWTALVGCRRAAARQIDLPWSASAVAQMYDNARADAVGHCWVIGGTGGGALLSHAFVVSR